MVISGFRSFHSACARQARRSRRTVEQMLARLEREPAALLADFYARCGVPSDSRRSGTVDADSLRRDLQLLQESVLELSAIPAAAQVLILHGSRDRVVPVERAEELRETAAQQRACHRRGGRPRAAPDACWRVLGTSRTGLAWDAACMTEASFKARVVENFSRSASTYDCHAEEQRAGAATLAKCAAECAENLVEGPVLEIGCGTGFLERVLSRTLP